MVNGFAMKLEDAITNRPGALPKSAEQLLAYSHEMLGKFSFDWLDYTDASGHFQQLRELGEELNIPTLSPSPWPGKAICYADEDAMNTPFVA